MKHLRVEYNGIVLFDAGVDEVNWTDGPNGIQVSGKYGKQAQPQQGSGLAGSLAEILTSASKKQTQEKRAQLAASTESNVAES